MTNITATKAWSDPYIGTGELARAIERSMIKHHLEKHGEVGVVQGWYYEPECTVSDEHGNPLDVPEQWILVIETDTVCTTCEQPRSEHGDRGECFRDGYAGRRFTYQELKPCAYHQKPDCTCWQAQTANPLPDPQTAG